MKRIHYAGDVILTGDEIADAVVSYAAALARGGTSAEVTIPVRSADGGLSEASLLLGPASQLVAGPAEFAGDEIAAPEIVEEIRRATEELGPVRAVALDTPVTEPVIADEI